MTPRRTKIVCTLGPSSESAEVVNALVVAGLDCARLNLSHGTHAEHQARIDLIRAAEQRYGRPLAVMADLQGPKLRIARGMEPLTLAAGDEVALYGEGDAVPTGKALAVDPPVIASSLSPGDRVLLNDGLIRLETVSREEGYARCRVLVGGLAKPRQGVCAPGVELPIPSLTRKDLTDLDWALAAGVDFVALSFVRSPEDVYSLKMQIASLGYDTPVVAKIEQAEALLELDLICDAADVVMVARGDLGVEIGPERVPLAQKRIIRCSLDYSRPVITATQMLESMVHQSTPTRAEASDVANAVLDGSSAVMLSGETANGAYPVQAVEAMASITHQVEHEIGYRPTEHPLSESSYSTVKTAITSGAVHIAEQIDAKAIIVPTDTGSTAAACSRHRPQRLIVGLASDERALRRMALSWGVVPLLIKHCEDVETLWQEALTVVREQGLVAAGERVVITAGSAMNVSGSTDLIKVAVV
jgi:pyruvate kinase